MILDINLDLERIIATPGTIEPISSIVFKRDTDTEIAVRFWRDNVRVELASGATGNFGVKPKGAYDAAPLVLCESWTKTGSGATAVYTFETSFSGAALAALLFSGDDNSGNDVASIEAISEILWVESGKKRRSQTVATIIANDVVKSEDTTPTPVAEPIGATAPTQSVAVVTINPTGSNNSITWTAANIGTEGNLISITYVAAVDSAVPVVTISGNAVTVTPGSRSRFSVTGTLTSNGSTPISFPILLNNFSIVNSAPDYTSGTFSLSVIFDIGSSLYYWYLLDSGTGATWRSTIGYAYASIPNSPIGLTLNPISPATGAVTLTPLISSAQQVITAAGSLFAPSVYAKVRATAFLTVTGGVDLVSQTFLAGGSNTPSPPFIRVAGGFLYIQEAGTWKESRLYALGTAP